MMTRGAPPLEPVINVRGRKVALGPHRRDLIPLYTAWMNDFDVTRTLAIGMRPMTLEAEERWYEGQGGGRDAVFTIYELLDLRPIGVAGLHGIDYFQGTAEYGIAIGEKGAWGKGYGTEVTRLVAEYGFAGLGLNNIVLMAYSYNEFGIRAYRSAGFREIGRWREAKRLGGRAHDIVFMDCIPGDIEGGALGHLLPTEAPAGH